MKIDNVAVISLDDYAEYMELKNKSVEKVDKFADLKKAHAEGAEIECYSHGTKNWITIHNPIWLKNGIYRIRPLKVGDWIKNKNKVIQVMKDGADYSAEWKRITDQELINKLNNL